jgi:hypothetical protein
MYLVAIVRHTMSEGCMAQCGEFVVNVAIVSLGKDVVLVLTPETVLCLR